MLQKFYKVQNFKNIHELIKFVNSKKVTDCKQCCEIGKNLPAYNMFAISINLHEFEKLLTNSKNFANSGNSSEFEEMSLILKMFLIKKR